ncbi:MAG TPA: tRNA (cytidine(56)-2'-O)-methyltransferase [Nitrososphaerales archaeon]|nr:tRNA (cytidine(56)-2'-O)-methyltransferase [Nitrososphaerales archaeon]
MPSHSIRVLRVGHRFVRDDRTLTHLCLVSRALGAEAINLEEAEAEIVQQVRDVNESWGGSFEVTVGTPWRRVVEAARKDGRKVVHLTMYGLPLLEKLGELRSFRKLLVVVGGPKVPGEMYHVADYNISVTTQPHSEIAALAIALHEIQGGEELKRDFGKSKLRVLPKERGKQVITE